MSGGAWVLRIPCDGGTPGKDGCDAALRRMGATPWIAAIEVDARMTHQ